MKLLSIISSKLFFGDSKNEYNSKKTVNIAVILLICGVLAIALSSLFSSKEKTDVKNESERNVVSLRENEEKRLEKILSKIDGIDSVTVLISYCNSGITEALTEEKTVLKNSKSQNETVGTETQTERKPVYDGNKNIVTKTQYMPEIKGVCVFYSGVYGEELENKLYRAVKGALGIELHKTEVIHTSK